MFTIVQLRNLFWYHLGYELFNESKGRKLVTVCKIKGEQIRSNPNRLTPYSLDDPGWKRVVDYPEIFL